MSELLKWIPRGLTVAVIEDNPDHALLAAEALQEREHRVVLFATAGEALAAYRPHDWDVIALDYRLPDMDGIQALERLLAMPATPPVIMVTASGGEKVAVAALKKGARDYVVKTGTHGPELARAAEMAAVEHQLQKRLALHRQEIERRAGTDALTGVLNRHRLSDELKLLTERGEPYAVLMLDVDDFKLANDTYGHTAGDDLLVELTALLQRCIRDEDLLVRYGGDEFVIVLPGLDRETCRPVAARIATALESLLVASCPGFPISVAIGAADTLSDAPCEVLAEADRAMYRAKAEAQA